MLVLHTSTVSGSLPHTNTNYSWTAFRLESVVVGSAAEPAFQHRKRRTQPLRLAADRAPRAFGVIPTEHIQMRPRQFRRHEALQVQRGGDRAGHARAARVGQIGNAAFEVTLIRLPQRSEEHTSELQSQLRISYA